MRHSLLVLVSSFLLLAETHSVLAQLDLRLETPQASYLQYAPIPFTVRLKNLGGQSLVLKGEDSPPWLEFMVQSSDGLLIRPEKAWVPPSLSLQPGESKSFSVDLAPQFLVRDPGGYRARASARLASGETLLTEPLLFLIGRGEVVWSIPRGEGAQRRIYSLLRYYEDPNLGLYLRVEVPEQNLVFPAYRLGPFLPVGKPVAEFDDQNRLHILHLVSPGQYRLSVVNQDGKLLREELRQETVEKPKLQRSPDGLVDVKGGMVILPSHLREKLSLLQAQAGLAQPGP